MKNYEMLSFSSPSALAETAAQSWLDLAEEAARQNGPHLVALSGGRIARDFFAAVVAQAKARNLSLGNAHFFWADERCVPPEDAESNFHAANQLLFQPLGISSSQVHRIRGELRPEDGVRAAVEELRRFAPVNAGGDPVLDVIFLGMGEDGHVASLFPGQPMEEIDSKEIYLAVTAAKPPPKRITLTYRVIAAAQNVWVLASGPGKTEALQKSLIVNGQTPLARVLRMRGETKIFSGVPLA